MVSATGHISGGHLNPAVTFGALVGKMIGLRDVIVYWVSQLLGALVAALFLVAIFPSTTAAPILLGSPGLSAGVSPATGIFVEAVLTFFLVFVVYGTGIDPKARSAR